MFSFDVEGDVGDDPNLMSLWFNQPSLGLPSKVSARDADNERVLDAVLRSITRKMSSEKYTPIL